MMMKTIVFITFLVIVLASVSHGYSHSRSAGSMHRLMKSSRQFSLGANKLDGNIIEGDLKPLSNNVLVKVKEVASNTAGGLFIPDNAKERPTEGTLA